MSLSWKLKDILELHFICSISKDFSHSETATDSVLSFPSLGKHDFSTYFYICLGRGHGIGTDTNCKFSKKLDST
jgi:hypothetical protein